MTPTNTYAENSAIQFVIPAHATLFLQMNSFRISVVFHLANNDGTRLDANSETAPVSKIISPEVASNLYMLQVACLSSSWLKDIEVCRVVAAAHR